MIRTTVSASREYEVITGAGLINECGKIMRDVAKDAIKLLIVSETNVAPLYLDKVKASAKAEGFEVYEYVFEAGEVSKNINTVAGMWAVMAKAGFTRTDLVAALGGGVTGDMAGFAAASFLRGIAVVQIPTSLLAMVDAAVGGKTGIDLPEGKNQVGAFWQPAAVICDPDLMETLPEAEFRCGTAEVVKYGMLGSAAFFESLEQHGVKERLEDVIRTCVEMKRDIVREDEFDRGGRQVLNLGHTFGHAVEACSRFTILHGQAVAIGMALITRAAVRRGDCPQEALERLVALLERFGLPTGTDYGADELFAALGTDKKRSGSTMHLVIPEDIGRCRIEAMPLDEVRELLRLGGVQ